LQHAVAGTGLGDDGARVGQRPAGVHVGQIGAGNARQHRPGAGGDEQAVISQRAAGVEADFAFLVVEPDRLAMHLADAELFEVVVRLAQIGAFLADAVHQHVGDGHARIGRRVLAADQDDFVVGRGTAQGLGGDDAGRAVAEYYVSHCLISSVGSGKQTGAAFARDPGCGTAGG
jgi:hypothetical protein